jgi:hypothetical protein
VSVLTCNKGGCPNIMCDRYSHKYGYICNDCFEQLVRLGVGTDLDEYMGGDYKVMVDEDQSERYFSKIFEDR